MWKTVVAQKRFFNFRDTPVCKRELFVLCSVIILNKWITFICADATRIKTPVFGRVENMINCSDFLPRCSGIYVFHLKRKNKVFYKCFR